MSAYEILQLSETAVIIEYYTTCRKQMRGDVYNPEQNGEKSLTLEQGKYCPVFRVRRSFSFSFETGKR